MLHRLASCGAEPAGELRLVVQPPERGGDGRSVVRFDQEPVRAALDELRDPRDGRRHDRQAARHRLDEHVRDAVAVAAREHAAGQAERVRPLVFGAQLLLRHRAGKLHDAARAALGDQPADRLLVLTGLADDRRRQVDAVVPQQRAGLDEHVESLLGTRCPTERMRSVAALASGLGGSRVEQPVSSAFRPW